MSYLNSVATTRGVVDSVVAAHSLDMDLSPKWAVAGQSQGGSGRGHRTVGHRVQCRIGRGIAPGLPRCCRHRHPGERGGHCRAGRSGRLLHRTDHVDSGAAEAIDEFLGIPTAGYDRPVFLGVGLQDRDVPPTLTLTFADALKANGQDVTLKVYPDADHSATVLDSIPDPTEFLTRALR